MGRDMPVFKKPLPDKEFLKQCLSYNKVTGKLTWKSRPDWHFKDERVAMLRNAKYAGKEAGILNKTSGYVYVSLDNITYKAHRLIYVLVYGREPEDEVDHVNGVKTDNRLVNLRLATKSENQRNARIRKDNTTLFKNVSFHKRQQKYNARCTIGGKRVHIGSFDTPEMAYEAYRDYARAHYGEFAKL